MTSKPCAEHIRTIAWRARGYLDPFAVHRFVRNARVRIACEVILEPDQRDAAFPMGPRRQISFARADEADDFVPRKLRNPTNDYVIGNFTRDFEIGCHGQSWHVT